MQFVVQLFNATDRVVVAATVVAYVNRSLRQLAQRQRVEVEASGIAILAAILFPMFAYARAKA